MPVTTMNTPGVFRSPRYDHIARVGMGAGDLVFLAGQVGRDAAGNLVGPGNAAAQAAQLFANIGAHLASIGAGPCDVVKVTTLLTDRADRDAVGAAHEKFFAGHRPPNTLVIVAGLALAEMKVEVEVIVHAPAVGAEQDPA
jgi:2-iminobutanoate/2-iminopropanoate deaminase